MNENFTELIKEIEFLRTENSELKNDISSQYKILYGYFKQYDDISSFSIKKLEEIIKIANLEYGPTINKFAFIGALESLIKEIKEKRNNLGSN